MKRMLIGGVIVALAAVPAAIGLWGNASFSQAVPVRVPDSGQIVTDAPSPMPSATPSASPSGIDDHGGDTPRDQRIEPGDDRDVQGGSPSPSASPDDHGGSSNSGPGSGSGGAESGSGHGGSGHGGDDDGSDDHGGSGQGSDD